MWAALVVQIMNEDMDRGSTRSQLLAKLTAVPNGMEELLRSMLLDSGPFLLPILQWVLFSRRQLSVQELCFAVTTRTGCPATAVWDRTEITSEQMHAFVLSSSRGLVEYTGTAAPVAQFVHESVSEYLHSGGLAALDSVLLEGLDATSDRQLATRCQIYFECVHRYVLRNNDRERLSYFISDSRAPFLRYALWSIFHHMEVAYKGGALPLVLLDVMTWGAWVFLSNIIDPTSCYDSPTTMSLFLEYHCEVLVKALLQRQLIQSRHAEDDTAMLRGVTELDSIPVIDVNKRCGGDYGTALHTATHHGSIDVIRLLLDCGANPRLKSGGYINMEPLIQALASGRDDVAELFLRYGADPNRKGDSIAMEENCPLEMISGQSSAGGIKLLMEHGAHPNGRKSRYGAPLVRAILSGQAENARVLLAYGGDSNGSVLFRPLHAAVESNMMATVQLLLDAGANPNGRDRFDHTALQITTQRRVRRGQDASKCVTTSETRMAIAEALLDAGADVNAADVDQRTTFLAAYHHRRLDLARLFVDRGADLSVRGHKDVVRTLQDWEKKIPGPVLEDSDSDVSTVADNGHDW